MVGTIMIRRQLSEIEERHGWDMEDEGGSILAWVEDVPKLVNALRCAVDTIEKNKRYVGVLPESRIKADCDSGLTEIERILNAEGEG